MSWKQIEGWPCCKWIYLNYSIKWSPKKDKMNKKRHFLEPPEIKDYLVKGERFTKWSEVGKHFKFYNPKSVKEMLYVDKSVQLKWLLLFFFIFFKVFLVVTSSNVDVWQLWFRGLSSINVSFFIQDSTKTHPVTMKMDPKGFYVYWINQSKVINTQSINMS